MMPTLMLLLLLAGAPEEGRERLAFVGLHGGVFEQLKKFEAELEVELEYLSDERIASEDVDLARYRIVFLQHLRNERRDAYRRLIRSAKKRDPALRIFSIPGGAESPFPELVKEGLIEHDPRIRKYYGSTPENLRRLLIYALVTYVGRPGGAQPPVEVALHGLYHPDREGLFDNVQEFVRWSRERGRDVTSAPRAVIAVHRTHLLLQQPLVVDALIHELERHGALAVAMLDYSDRYEQMVLECKPQAVIHLCHSSEKVAFREKAGVPHLHSLFFRNDSIDEWRQSATGLGPHEIAFQVVAQEVLGAIEPQVGAGTLLGGGSDEAFTPIPDRIEHLVARAVSWMRLGRIANHEKKVAFIYWDREMGKAELMRGSATGMFMNGPRSLVKVLERMKREGYRVSSLPAGEDELVEWMTERGRQIGIWAPGELERLAASGDAALVPAESYRKWFEEKVPEARRRELILRWGKPPGRFLVWERDGERFIVIPRIDLGNVVLLPQPLRGEAHDTSLVHDRLVPPPHNYLATYFWLEEELGADALVHFGTHGTEFLLPGKAVGLAGDDWTDIIMGDMPNIQPWVINNLGEAPPVRRRAYALLIDHLVPPSVNAELSDELLNLHNDIDKWVTLAEGALKEKFRASITRQLLRQNLDRDLHLDLAGDRLLASEEIRQVLEYLHGIHNETTPVSLHVFGEPPRDDLLIPYLVTCLRRRFLDRLGEIVPVPPEEALSDGDREKFLRRRAEEALELLLRRGFTAAEAIGAVGGRLPAEGALPEEVRDGFDLAVALNAGFGRTREEITNLLAALDGRYIPPGPGNSPDRNPAAVPTGRNMYVMNPEEVPSRPSWEIGKALVDQLLEGQLRSKGRYPRKIAFTLNSFATFQDYGVMESQILYTMGIRPVWDARNIVSDVELISAEELGRPRIDVFISALSYYRDMLPTRMRLLDRAIRLAAAQEEEGNLLFENSARVLRELEKQGTAPERAALLSRARIFGHPPGQYGSAGYYYLIERSGEWDTREELIGIYFEQVKHVYTEGIWGEDSPEAYDRHVQGSEIVLRSWSDRTRSPLSNKYVWYKGGSLSLAIQHLTGEEPEFFLSDVRDPDRAKIVDAEDALRRDYRVRLFNRKWIEGMMKEGYAGADQIAVHVSNTMGWEIMRESSVSDDIWEEIVDIYLRDSRNLSIREWFEAENPFAFQELAEILLETVRKGYWSPDEATLQEIAVAYARSVARHGEGGGLRGGGNRKLEEFVEETLEAPGKRELEELLARYETRAAELRAPRISEPAEHSEPEASSSPEVEVVEGHKMERMDDPISTPERWPIVVGACFLLLFIVGLWKRAGGPS